MTTAVVTVKADSSIDDCMRLMTEKRVRHLPVLEGMELVGIVSIGDLVRAIIQRQKATIDHLRNYIAS